MITGLLLRCATWGSPLECRPTGRVPAEIGRAFACDRVQRARCVARTLESFERFPAHRRVDVQVRYTRHRAELLQHEEDDAVMHQAAPVAPTDQVALFIRR